MTAVRWNMAVSPEMDQSVRMFIAAQGGGRKGNLSHFIEEAVRAYLLEQAKIFGNQIGQLINPAC